MRQTLRSMQPGPILGLSAPSFVVVAAALTLTFAVLAGEAESRRANVAAPAAAPAKPANHTATGNEVGRVSAQQQLVASGNR